MLWVGRRTQKVTTRLAVGVPDLSLRLKDIAGHRQIPLLDSRFHGSDVNLVREGFMPCGRHRGEGNFLS